MNLAQGSRNYHAGRVAEDAVAAHYERQGAKVIARRWRGKSGEIDLILGQGAMFVFVEVKAAADHARAAASLRPPQIDRLWRAVDEFVGQHAHGTMTDVRLDVALVDGGGRIDVLENAFA